MGDASRHDQLGPGQGRSVGQHRIKAAPIDVPPAAVRVAQKLLEAWRLVLSMKGMAGAMPFMQNRILSGAPHFVTSVVAVDFSTDNFPSGFALLTVVVF